MSIRDFRQQGILPMALSSLLAKLGTSDPIHPYQDLKSLIDEFDMGKFSKATPKFSMDELSHLNKKVLHQLSYEKAIAYTHFPSMTPEFWEVVRPNLEQLEDVKMWWTICRGEVHTFAAAEDRVFITEALQSLPKGPWDPMPWAEWIQHLKTACQRKGADLFMPLRRALTGQDHGPELKTLLEIMGPDLAKNRLEYALK